MAIFSGFANILPDPINTIGSAGQSGGVTAGGFKSIKLRSVDMFMKSISNSGRRNTQDATYHKWAIDISYNPMTQAEFNPIYTFLLRKKHTLEPFYVDIPDLNSIDPGIPTLVLEHAKGVERLLIDISLASATAPSLYFSVGAESKVYMATRVETNTNFALYSPTIGVDEELLHITPSLQSTTIDGAALDFQTTKFHVQQVGDVSYSINDKNLYSFSLKLEEVPINV